MALGLRTQNKVYGHGKLHSKRVACWGWRIGKRMYAAGKDVLVMERAYLGDRFHWTSLGWNGLNGFATFPEYPDDGGARFEKNFGPLKPWKQDGQNVLILGQVPNDASLRGMNMIPWYEKMARQANEKYGLPVKFRPHPDLIRKRIVQNIRGAEKSEGTLQEALEEAAFCICWNSNSSVDAVINGVPTVVGDRGSMAYEVCGHSIDQVIRPDREEWAAKLAWKQWEPHEIASGEALKRLVL